MYLKYNQTLIPQFVLTIFLIFWSTNIFSQPPEELESNTGDIIITLPTVEVRMKSKEEIAVLQDLELKSGMEYSEILYYDRILDDIQKKYEVPAPILWAILCIEIKKLNSTKENRILNNNTQPVFLVDKIPPATVKTIKAETYFCDYNFVGESLEKSAEIIREASFFRDCKNCQIKDYECWIDALSPLYDVDGKLLEPGWNKNDDWKQEMLNVLDEYNLKVLIR